MVDFVSNNEQHESNIDNSNANSLGGPLFYVSDEYDRIITSPREKVQNGKLFANSIAASTSNAFYNKGYENGLDNNDNKRDIQVNIASFL